MQTLRAWFDSVDTDRSGRISAVELAKMTFPGQPGQTPLAGRPIGHEVAAKVVALFDKDGKQEMDFFEYAAFFEFSSQLQNAFLQVDRTRGQQLSAQETQQALEVAMLKISLPAVEVFWRTRVRPPQRGLDMAGFMNLSFDIAEIRQTFERVDLDKDGKLNMDEVYNLTARLQKAPQNLSCSIM